jgi:acyl-CoA thioester hydrolase
MHKGDGTKVATINVDGAWIDTEKRKLAALPPELLKVFQSIPKIEG